MPTMLDCPACKHAVPVTEATRATAVECPYCARSFTAFQEMSDSAAKKAADAKSAKAKAKRRRDDDDDDDDDDEDGPKKSKRGAGGSGMLVIVVGAFGLLAVMAGLGFTSYLLYTYDPDDYVSSSSSNKPSTNSSNNNPFRPNTTPNRPNNTPNFPKNNTNNNPFPDPPNFESPPPKPTTFEVTPVPGPEIAISPPAWLPAIGPKDIKLPGKVDRVAVGGRGKYLVLHSRAQSQLSVFDISIGTMVSNIAVGADQLHLAAGASKLVTLKEWSHEFNIYSLPDLKLIEEFKGGGDLFHPANGVGMGSNTDGPVVVNDVFGEVRLLDISGKHKFIPAAKDKPGVHSGMVRASADGRLYILGSDRETASLMEKNKKWVGKSYGNIGPLFPGPDGQTLYGEGRILNAADGRIVGSPQAPATWYVPAVHGNHFLKVSGVKDTSPQQKHQVMMSIHANRDPAKAVSPVGVLDETAKLVEWWGDEAKFPPLDQHLFLIPEAKMLLVIPASKDRIVARRVDIK